MDAFLIIGGSTLISVLAMYLIRRLIGRETLERCHEVGGIILAVVGTLYAIVAGLIVAGSQGKYDAARQMAVTEANMLSDIFHLSANFEKETRREIRQSIYDYSVAVLDQDWSRVNEEKEKEATIPPYRRLWHAVMSYNPERANQQQCYSTMLNNMEQLSSARRYRMVAAKGKLPAVLWSALIGGAIIIELLTYFFFVESLSAQTLMTAFVAIALSTNIYLIYMFQNPYRVELNAKQAGFGFSFSPEWFRVAPEPLPLESPGNIDSRTETNK